MTISSEVRKAGPFTGTGAQTLFPFTFAVFGEDDVLVIRTDATPADAVLRLGVDYTVAVNPGQDVAPGGTVRLTAALPSGWRLTLASRVANLQPLDLTNLGGFYPKTIMRALDRLTVQLQQLAERVSRAMKVSISTGGDVDISLPPASPGQLIVWNATGRGLTNLAPESFAPDSAYALGARLADAVSPAGGAGMVPYSPSIVYPPGSVGAALRRQVVLADYPGYDPTGATPSTAAFVAAIAALGANGGDILVPAGRHVVDNVEWPSNIWFIGAGPASVLEQAAGAYAVCHAKDGGSASTASNTRNIGMRNLKLQGRGALDGFQEVLHLVFLQGASDVTFDHVTFSGWQGDALYIGTGNERGQAPSKVRHNERVRVLDCHFDGETRNNRNAISVIDCNGFWCERSYFTRCSKFDMPGCIDIEPDGGGTPAGTAAVIQNVNILWNEFVNNNGAAIIAINFPNAITAMTTPPKGITILGNEIDGGAYAYTVGISINGNFTVGDTTPLLDVLLSDNGVRNVSSPFYIAGVRDVRLRRNRWSETRYSAEIGSASGAVAANDIDFQGDSFTRVAQDNAAGGNAVYISAGERVAFTGRCLFFWCGKADDTYNANIVLSGTGRKADITVEDCVFIARAVGGNSWSVRNDAPSALVAGLTRHARNRLVNITNAPESFGHDFMANVDPLPLSLQSGWVNFGASHADAKVFKDAAGVVHINCTIKSGSTTAGTTIFQTPPKFRPGRRMVFPVACGAALGTVMIEETQGDMQVRSLPGNAEVSICISYAAGA